MDEESYEKSLIMYVVIGEPRQIAGKLKQAKTLALKSPTGLDSFILKYFYYLQREKKEVNIFFTLYIAVFKLIMVGPSYNKDSDN